MFCVILYSVSFLKISANHQPRNCRMNSPYTVKRLDSMLRIWEQILFVANAEVKVAKPSLFKGAIANWHRFRRTVLDHSKPFNKEDFEMPMELFPNYFTEVISYSFFPDIFAKWSRTSRRVYALSEDTQIDMELTSTAGVTWGDIHPPFPCFIITLPLPLAGLFKNTIDTLVVEMGKGYIRVLALGSELDIFKPMPEQMKKGIASASRHGNIGKLRARAQVARAGNYCYVPANQYGERLCNNPNLEIIADQIGTEKVEFLGIHATSEKEKEESLRFWIPIYRIVIGLCMHLDDLQEMDKGVPKTQVDTLPGPVTLDPKAVTSTEHLLNVECGSELTDEERTVHGIIRKYGSIEALKELGAQFRSAHRRRPPGQGDNPNARKSVKVRCTIVNEKRLPMHGLPAGTLVEVK